MPKPKVPKEPPIIPLDYGGYDPSISEIYTQNLPNLSDFEQGMTDFGEAREIRLRQERENEQLMAAKLNEEELKLKVSMIAKMSDRKQIMDLDVDLPSVSIFLEPYPDQACAEL